MADGRMYIMQASFAAGEISPEVAARVDLDKYQAALLQAKNCFIRPYGSVYKRPGTEYLATLTSGDILLQEFAVNTEKSFLLVFGHQYVSIWKDGVRITITQDGVQKQQMTTPFSSSDLKKLRFAQSADVMFIASGKYPVQVLKRISDTEWDIDPMELDASYYDVLTGKDGVTISVSVGGTTGNVTLQASANIFASGQVGNWIRLTHNMPSETKTLKLTTSGDTPNPSDQSGSMLASAKGWKVVSHGTWTGSFSVEYKKNGNWEKLRTYTAEDDYNASESGTFDEPTFIRINGTITSGSVTIDLTRLPYKHHGTVKLTGYTDQKHMDGTVVDRLGGTGACDSYAFGPWSGTYKYPSCVAFFQDRLCFAANARYPYMVWMSRTGDYYNFGTEEVSGTLTDDSAIAVSFISRKDFRILHLIATADLIVMTEGNEWIISGSSTVTPTKVTPQLQTFRGCTDVEPVIIGSDIIYVQRRGKTVRDMQYNYASDNYDGADLTLLAKHITKNTTIVDVAYRQEPDSMLFCVLSNGACACLTYIKDQKVYAWSKLKTDGLFKAVCVVSGGDGEEVYFVVRRKDGNNQWQDYLEKLSDYVEGDVPNKYVMLDSAYIRPSNQTTKTNTVTAAWLAKKKVDVLADGDHYKGLQCDNSGVVALPDGIKCKSFVVGLPYTSVIELPNIEVQMRDGSMQGRKKKVSEAILRLTDSLGGEIGVTETLVDHINYDEFGDQVVKLYSGDKHVTVPNVPVGGFEDTGRVVITHSSPYPFNLSSIVRVVTLGG